ncbi:MAG: DUF72 domain-containing protein [Planctomycetota bacterium]
MTGDPARPAVRIGTCGFGGRQDEYVRAFDLVEVQQTFHRPPPIATARGWRARAPDGFEFTLKAFQAITHPPGSPTFRRSGLSTGDRARCGGFRDSPVVRKAWKATLEIARALDARFVVFQTPPSFRPTDECVADLGRFFQWAHRDRLRFGWEPRGPGWTDDLVRTLCRELSITHVVDPFERPTMRGRPPYFRLHGVGGHRHRYTDDELAQLRACCLADVTYCLFNNASGREDAGRLRAGLEPTDVPGTDVG